ncbi:D-aspartate oxidase [Lingula anatina]|uniref:D-aspartate oxidase n=1 Tax=Lingula anatina TaxID=7574 RepID=A0A1S3KC43_LINAN|nr:D-aspartate oxidase [Lingula anatina]|eukprot:XP_013419826.1 D-aspartate oxidase [Lingula anatina]
MVKIAVVGAGILGLSSAVQIQAAVPNARVTVIADKFAKNTTSDGAAGVFRPTLDLIKADPELVRQWSQDGWDFYSSVAKSSDSAEAGIHLISGFQVFNQPRERPIYHDIVYHFRDMTPQELQHIPGNFRYGWFCTTLCIESRWFLPWLMRKFRLNGGQVEHRTLHSLAELADTYDLVVNCSGLRAKTLVNDHKMYPARGQMLRVEAPWQTHFIYDLDSGPYIIPCAGNVVVGGQRQVGNFNPEKDPKDTQNLWEWGTQLSPSLKSAKLLWEWVGLRPHRDPPRVEMELLKLGSRLLKVIHNYGQGANGITLGWGCSKHATRLVLEALSLEKTKSSKL